MTAVMSCECYISPLSLAQVFVCVCLCVCVYVCVCICVCVCAVIRVVLSANVLDASLQ